MRYPSLLARLGQTRAILLWERTYAALMPLLVVFGCFAGLAFFGAFAAMPQWLHWVSVVGSAGASFWAVVIAARRWRLPVMEEELARLEEDSALPRGTLADLTDSPFGAGESAMADDPLWARHKARLRALAARARPQRPRALVDRTDPYGLRVVALLLLVTGGIVAGPDAGKRLAGAVTPSLGGRTAVTADVWIEPPAYTRMPPRFLARRNAPVIAGTAEPLAVPEGSVLHARLPSGARRLRRPVTYETTSGRAVLDSPDGATGLLERRLDQTGTVIFRTGRGTARFPVIVVPDDPPTIRQVTAPETEGGTRTRLDLLVEDDYGIEDARLVLTLAEELGRGPDTPAPSRPDVEETFPLPGLRGEPGSRQIAVDLTEHPWAGLPVHLAVEITDGAGQSARSRTEDYFLPTRSFYNPLSRTVVAERQNLSLAPNSWRRSLRLFDALTVAPDMFAADAKEYILLRTAYHELSNGNGENIEGVVESFWPLAIALEDEGLTLARQRLEAAQEALREALANGAPQSEVDRLVEELRSAMNEYLQALASSGDADSGQMADGDTLEGRDLNDILDEIARLRREGDSAEARARLAELEQLLQNLRIAQGDSGGSGEGQGQGAQQNAQGQSGEGEGEGGDQGPLGETGDLIDQQRRLSDDTFAAGRGDGSADALGDRQRDLAQEAERLAEEAARQGAGAQEFSDAAGAMADAADAIAGGDIERGLSRQEEALDSLRRGGQALADTLMRERAEREGSAGADGDGRPEGGRPGEGQSLTGSADRDPLGRRYGGPDKSGVAIPDFADPARVRELTDQLRERLSDPGLEDTERRYLERLLRRF